MYRDRTRSHLNGPGNPDDAQCDINDHVGRDACHVARVAAERKRGSPKDIGRTSGVANGAHRSSAIPALVLAGSVYAYLLAAPLWRVLRSAPVQA